MILTFKDLKNSRKESLVKLQEKLNQMSSGGYEEDERYWQPTADKSGNGHAIIRFIPDRNGDTLVRLWSHGFKGPTGMWYIENCLSTLNKPDPVMEMNSKLWAQGKGSDGQKFVSGTGSDNPGSKRKLNFISNVYIVEDPAKPENNGKVFLYKYGKKIYDKIYSAANPAFPDVEPFDAFDMLGGANFHLKIRRVEGQRNYDSSEWDLIKEKGSNVKKPAGALSEDEGLLEKIFNASYLVNDEVSPEKFKTYNDLKDKLNRVMSGESATSEREVEREVVPERSEKKETPPWEPIAPTTAEDFDDDKAFFERIKKLGA